MKASQRTGSLFCFGALLSLGGTAMLFAGGHGEVHFAPWFFAGLFAMTCGMVLLWHFQPDKKVFATILLFAVVLRLVFLLWPHDSDLNRYIWEGQIQHAGLNPYLTPPAAAVTEPLRNGIWEGVNHKEYPAIYGPLAQLLFRAATLLPHADVTLKIVFLLCDLGVLWFLLAALRRYGMATRHGWLYAAHPLPPLLLVGEGHLEPLLLLPLFTGFLAIHWGHFRRGLLLVGLAATVKIWIVALFPFAVRHTPKKFWPLTILPLCLWLPFGDGFFTHGQTLYQFADSEDFNSLIQLLSCTLLPSAPADITGAIVFAVGLVCLWLNDTQRLRAALLAVGLFLLCSPVVHPWYFALVLPFAVLFRSLAWLVLCTTATSLLFVTLQYRITLEWWVPSWLLVLEFAPFVLALLFGLGRRSTIAPAWFAPPTRLSILLPVCNEAANLRHCLDTLTIPAEIPAEILVIDGGSTDATLALAQSDPRVRTLQSPPGRGIQIATGYRAAQGDLLVVVHADARLGPDTLSRIWQHCRENPHVAGGACTARYNHPALRFRITEMLNDLRVLLCGIAFGDQVQFFRRAAISPNDFPAYRLMEDIELSIAIRHGGAHAFLRTPILASHRRWEKVGYTTNTLQVVALFTVYLVLRSLGLIRDRGEAFYRYYYGIKRKGN